MCPACGGEVRPHPEVTVRALEGVSGKRAVCACGALIHNGKHIANVTVARAEGAPRVTIRSNKATSACPRCPHCKGCPRCTP